jgi:predicted TIM-barrel fold metal-dependent hydrolase
MNAPFKVYDADNHLYEPQEAFLRHLPDKFKKDFYFVDVNGRKKLVIGGLVSEWIPNPTFEVVAAPGAHEKMFRAENKEGLSLREMTGKPIRPPPEWRTGDGRIAVLDRQGVHATLVFPTLASAIEERLGVKEVVHALFHSLNMWIDEEWGFARRGRLFSVPFISLTNLDLALAELDFVLEKGARAINIRPAPVPGRGGSRSFGFPEFDPFWARVQDAGIFVTLHGSDSGYNRMVDWWNGEDTEAKGFGRGSFASALDLIGRAISDSVSAFICHGVLDRFPKLRVVSVENGANWVTPLLKRYDRMYGQMPQAFKRHPRTIFEEQVYVAPFFEDDMAELKKIVPVERMLFGSDFPHPEGLAEPLDFLREFDGKGYSGEELEKVFSTNLKGLLEGAAG